MSSGRGGDGLVEDCEHLAGDVALQAANDLLGGLAFGETSCHVVLGRLMPAQPHDHNPVQRRVGLPVTTTVEAMPAGLGAMVGTCGRASRMRARRTFHPD